MIAAAATFHVQNVAFGEKESYASLESIGVMAEAWDEHDGGSCPGGSIIAHVDDWHTICMEEDVVVFRTGGHVVYCPSTGQILEYNTYTHWVKTLHGECTSSYAK